MKPITLRSFRQSSALFFSVCFPVIFRWHLKYRFSCVKWQGRCVHNDGRESWWRLLQIRSGVNPSLSEAAADCTRRGPRELSGKQPGTKALRECERRFVMKKKTLGFPSQLFKSTKVLMATAQGRHLGYHTPEQVSNQEPRDSHATHGLSGGTESVL